jgi:hypothetical protein
VDQDHGQSGWQIGLNFTTLNDLANQLSTMVRPGWVAGTGTIGRGEIRQLAIHSHGNAGILLVNGRDGTPLTATSSGMHGDLHRIGLMTPDDRANPAVILLVGCLAGRGAEGTALLTALSRVWPNRLVVAFATLGYVAGGAMKRNGEFCTEPGMRDTDAVNPGEADRTLPGHWTGRAAWPWASEASTHAKVALNGAITRGATL